MPKRCVIAWRCSRSGKLVANGRISDIQAFEVRGWELDRQRIDPRVARSPSRAGAAASRSLGEHRYSLELPLEPAPELLLRELIGEGAQLVSLNPIRETLEDYFVKKVAEQTSARVDARAAS